jgi:flagellar biosynthesis regulator FlbT
MFRRSLPLLLASFVDEQICSALKQIDRMVGEDHIYEALKAIRALYPLERRALAAMTMLRVRCARWLWEHDTDERG